MVRVLLLVLCLGLCGGIARSESLRIATFNVGLSRDGPGVLLGELRGRPKPDVLAAVAIIRAVRPDVLVIQKFDHDPRGRALAAFAGLLAAGEDGIDYPYRFAGPVNAGVVSGLDLDGDGLVMGWNDALGWGKYPGHGGMAVLSRLPLDEAGVRTFRGLLWRDLPDASLPRNPDGTAFFGPEALALLPLSSRAHWDVPVLLADGRRLHLLTANPTPPLFDGPEGMNRLRNRDEVAFWGAYLGGAAFLDDQGRSGGAAEGPLVVLGDFNLDPFDGAGDGAAMAALLGHPRLTDPAPRSAGAEASGRAGVNRRHAGPAALDTADWRETQGPGNLRVSYVLPSRDLEVTGAGVFWPGPGEAGEGLLAEGSPHRLVWVDIGLR